MTISQVFIECNGVCQDEDNGGAYFKVVCPGPYAGYPHKLKLTREYIIKRNTCSWEQALLVLWAVKDLRSILIDLFDRFISLTLFIRSLLTCTFS